MFSAEEIFAQTDYIIDLRFPDRTIPVEKFKIHFARMGEPSLNENLLQVLRQLPDRYKYRSLMPCISTIAPRGTDEFFDDLMHIKSELYHGTFQLQFSIHSTDETERNHLMPAKKWHLSQIARYGERFYQHFDPDKFLIKITPLNPTHTAAKNNLSSFIDAYQGPGQCDAIDQLREIGFEVLLSIGETQEDQIGSNCGQYIRRHLENHRHIENAYVYDVDTP